jgi:predicted transcriptional regulator
MSTVSSDSLDTLDAPSLADLLEPMPFKAMLLVACGLEDHQIAQCLGTTEQTIRNVLWNSYKRTGCRNSDDLVRRYFCEVASGLLNLGRLQRELAELEARVAQILHRLPESLSQYIH